MKHSNQHALAAVGFTLWALFAVAGLAQAQGYTYACPGSGVLVSHPSQCNTPTVPDDAAAG